MDQPEAEIYLKRLVYRVEVFERVDRRYKSLGNARLVGAIGAALLLWFVEANAPVLTWPTVAGLVALLLATSHRLNKLEETLVALRNASNFYSGYAKRRQRRKQSLPDLPIDTDHPFARDIDITGEDGLFERVNMANTVAGMQTLMRMLTTPASAPAIARRQAAVRELRSLLDFREDLYVAGSAKLRFVRTDPILAWASADAPRIPAWLAPLFFGLALAALGAAVAAAIEPSTTTVGILAGCLAVELAAWRMFRDRLKVPAVEAVHLTADIAELRELVEALEEQEFESQLLRSYKAGLIRKGAKASKLLGKLQNLIAFHEATRNQLVGLFGPLVLYGPQVALALERWRLLHGTQLRQWIDAVGALEALASLACYAYEQPGTAFPEIREGGVSFQANDLAHPLLAERAVANDIDLRRDRNVLVVSGANMAGKSTLLRTIGANVALAYAGGPMRATSASMTAMSVVASIRVTDSLQRGESRFSAELKRIRLMLDSIGRGEPTMMLIDELFGGTNSYDRFAGAAALAGYLLQCDNALAVLSTHDRNITQWAEEHGPGIVNVHFRDVFAEGVMQFDYRLAPGAASRGNAVELMKAAGIPVATEEAAARVEQVP